MKNPIPRESIPLTYLLPSMNRLDCFSHRVGGTIQAPEMNTRHIFSQDSYSKQLSTREDCDDRRQKWKAGDSASIEHKAQQNIREHGKTPEGKGKSDNAGYL